MRTRDADRAARAVTTQCHDPPVERTLPKVPLAPFATVCAVPAALKDSVDASVVDELARRFAAVDAGFDVEGFR